MAKKTSKQESKRLDTRKVVETAIKRGLDRNEIDQHDQRMRKEYAMGAQLILEQSVWKNETSRLIEEWRNCAASEAKNFDEVLDLRMAINGIMKLEEVFKSISSELIESQYSKIDDRKFDPI